MSAKITLTALLLAVMIGPAVQADDIGLITIKDSREAAQAEQILGRAADRPNANTYLVAVNDLQKQHLQRAGVAFEPLIRGIDDPADYLVVNSDNPNRPTVNVRAMASATLGYHRWLVPGGPATARSLERESGIWTRPVTEPEIFIRYQPPRIATGLTEVLAQFPDSLANRINIDSMASYVQRLEDFRTRYIYSDSNSAAIDWMAQKFADWGYTDITFPTFEYNGFPLDNVKVVKEGYAEPTKLIVIGGHFDSITYGQPTPADVYAPGADDNASGTALTMELARILADVPLRKTVIFMPFNAEEVGLVGSRAAAQQFRADDADLEIMLNYDMVAHDDIGTRQLDLSSTMGVYWEIAYEAATRVTNLDIVQAALGSSSDHAPFMQQNFDIINHIETDFNYAGWHTDVDHLDSLNLPFYENVGRMAVVTLAFIADAAAPGLIEQIVDVGNGSALEVFVADCQPTYEYKLRWRHHLAAYSDSVIMAPGECSYEVTGLTEGETYNFEVIGITPEGHTSIYTVPWLMTPYAIPRMPEDFVAEPQTNQIALTWALGIEADISHYNLYRSYGPVAPMTLYQTGLTDTTFIDQNVASGLEYSYKVSAVDYDGNESNLSAAVTVVPATFDGGILLADESNDGTGLPLQPAQNAYYDTLFDGLAHYVYPIDGMADALTRNIMGQYSSTFYIDDDFVDKYWDFSEDTVAWYAAHPTNILIAGHGILWHTEQNQTLPNGSIFKDDFLINSYETNYSGDFVGAWGQNGWPTVNVQVGRGPTKLGFIQKIAVDPAAEVIYTWNSFSDNAAWAGEPCGVAYDGPNGKRIFLAFPLYNMAPLEAQALIQHAAAWFGETTTEVPNGDINGDNVVSMTDVTHLINHLFIVFQPLPEPNQADVNGDCRVGLTDLTYLINYMFLAGPAPLPGCVD